MIKSEIKQKILARTVSLEKIGIRDLAWNQEDIKNLINSIMFDDIGILGGNVYKIEDENIIPLSDNWSCDPKANEKREEYYLRSKIVSKKYIEKYPVKDNEIILFSLVFTDEIG
ncbi:Imm40 family immunity protein [Candidatus Protochlamydia phocaeensis]|uniref:Imm40 family immunity protein n=1 Tax=Candidatus Protochlamydia phocaeensis TaxID=1414722 RepID=UPI00083856D6|nr:Imm40 family immunity protein [Candidatus Protochlamydia phocaeensis]